MQLYNILIFDADGTPGFLDIILKVPSRLYIIRLCFSTAQFSF